MPRFLRLTACFVLGAILGPVLIAAVSSVYPSADDKYLEPKEAEVGRLVAAYRAQLPERHLFVTVIPPPDGRECGYDPQAVFPDKWDSIAQSRKTGTFAAYEGYYALNRWRNNNEDEAYIEAIRKRLTENLSHFEAGFLRRCIQNTIFSSQCMAKVKSIGSEVERFDPKRRTYLLAGGHEDQVVCLYVDGVATRKGMTLSKPFDQHYADTHRRPW